MRATMRRGQESGTGAAAVIVGMILFGCAEPSPRSLPVTAVLQCSDPRPEICTLEYLPVCAVRDTGVRCATTPCESTELATYSNACSACNDPTVLGHSEGACEALQ